MSQYRLPRTVIVLGLVSFFNDLASDMVIPLIPILLTANLGAGPIALGLIEGMADAVASFLKLWSGRRSDLLGGKRKGLTVVGYVLSNIARPMLGIAGTWIHVLALRSVDRVGKGIRTAPRDAMVVDCTPPGALGFAFGFHRALDNAGAVAGALVAAAILAGSSMTLNQLVVWSGLPGIAGVLLVLFAVKEPLHLHPSARGPLPPLAWRTLSPQLQRYLLLLGLFTFARASETFIVLRGREIELSVVHLLLLWAALSLAKSLAASWGGRLADRVGKPLVMRGSWIAYALSFAAFGLAESAIHLWVTTLVYGFFSGMSEGAERALIGDFADSKERGTAYGWYNMILGFAAIPAGLLFGTIWHYTHAGFAFGYAACVAAISAYGLHRWMMKMRDLQRVHSARAC